MNKKILSRFVIVSLLFTSCSFFQKDSFEGKWQCSLIGGINETFEFVVAQDNSFSMFKNINYNSRDYGVEIKGVIEKDGRVNAEVIADGQSLGKFDGLFNFETGKGKWSAYVLSGEWTAVKK